MSMWGNQNQANNAPLGEVTSSPKVKATGEATFANTTPNAFLDGAIVGTYGVTAANAANIENATSVGWITETVFTGPMTALAVANGGTGYSNTDQVAITALGTTTANAATITTNANGTITAVTLVANVTVGAANDITYAVQTANGTASAGTGATFTPTLGGRAGRRQYETIVAMSSMTSNAGPTPL